MGRPAFPSRAQQEKLRKAAELPAADMRRLAGDGSLTLNLTPKALALIEVAH
jgi:predicted nucleic acid-binding Zn ribbon protein